MSLLAGSKLGPYEILAQIGAGGMGEVYRAHDPRLNRDVAIKVSAEKFSDRFEIEARAIAALNHPNICQLYDVGPNYLVMELVEGSPVAPIESARRLMDVAVQIADGLAAAHAGGIIHRDLKPDNILITREGRVKILDFGLAKAERVAESTGDLTRTMSITDPGTTIGTVNYMSPEQARAEPNLAPQSDQFSFGLVLYQLASGKRAFERPSAVETMAAIIREEAAPMPSSVPAPLRWVVERLLAKEPRERYDSTGDLYRELKQIREKLSQNEGWPPSAAVPLAPQRRRRSLAISLVATPALAAGVMLASLLGPPRGPDLSQYKFTRLGRAEREERGPEWSPDGKSIAFAAKVHGIEQIFLLSLRSLKITQLTSASSWCWYPFWSADGQTIYYESDDNLWSIPASGGPTQLTLERAHPAALHPDGKTLAFGRDGKMWVTSIGSGSVREFWTGPVSNSPLTLSRFSPDGAQLAVNDTQNVWVLPYPSGKPRKLYAVKGEEFLVGASWFPDSRSILTSKHPTTNTSALIRLNIEDGRQGTILPGAPMGDAALSRDGTKIAYMAGVQTGDVLEIDLANGAVHTTIAGDSLFPDWAPSGTHFAYGYFGPGGSQIMDQDASGAGFAHSLIDTGSPEDSRWSPDGARFVFITNDGPTIKLMMANASGSNAVLLDQMASVNMTLLRPGWSPDGQWIAYGRDLGDGLKLVKIRATPGATPVTLADAVELAPYLLAQWSPKGDVILYPIAEGLGLVSPDGASKRTLTSRKFDAYSFSNDGGEVYGVFHNTTGSGAEWQLYTVNVKTGAEKAIAALNFPPSTAFPAGFSIHPDGKRALTSVMRWPFEIWMLEGFEQQPKNWFARLFHR